MELTRSPILRTPETEPILAELDEIRASLATTEDFADRILLRNRQGELTQTYWRLLRQSQLLRQGGGRREQKSQH